MEPVLTIGSRKYTKNETGVFEVPLADLGPLRFVDVPFYSTVEVGGLPGHPDSYQLSISATHGGGPHNEAFHAFVHGFWEPGAAEHARSRTACGRRFAHIRRHFGTLIDVGQWSDGDGDEHRTRHNGGWLCRLLYSRAFTREENPQLAKLFEPVVARFNELIASVPLLLFICHASEDKQFVDRLASYIDSRGVKIWYDKREIKIGESIVARINDGLNAASHLVVVLSVASVGKPWVQKELSAALMNQLKDRSIAVAPLLCEDCQIPPLLSNVKYADCRGDIEAGFQQLVDDILGVHHAGPAA